MFVTWSMIKLASLKILAYVAFNSSAWTWHKIHDKSKLLATSTCAFLYKNRIDLWSSIILITSTSGKPEQFRVFPDNNFITTFFELHFVLSFKQNVNRQRVWMLLNTRLFRGNALSMFDNALQTFYNDLEMVFNVFRFRWGTLPTF